MTCKDCIHERACFTYSGGMVRTSAMGDKAETKCGLFKNKSDYAEVKHGEWIIVNNRDFEQVDAKCSICGYTDVFDETGFYKYCPECGAKMKGGTKNESL